MALPQWHIAQRESWRVASSKASAASSYWNECIRATPRSKSDCACAVAEIGNVTVPTWPAASAARDGAATPRRTRKTAETDDDSLTIIDCRGVVVIVSGISRLTVSHIVHLLVRLTPALSRSAIHSS